jgi:hypothetical protein
VPCLQPPRGAIRVAGPPAIPNRGRAGWLTPPPRFVGLGAESDGAESSRRRTPYSRGKRRCRMRHPRVRRGYPAAPPPLSLVGTPLPAPNPFRGEAFRAVFACHRRRPYTTAPSPRPHRSAINEGQNVAAHPAHAQLIMIMKHERPVFSAQHSATGMPETRLFAPPAGVRRPSARTCPQHRRCGRLMEVILSLTSRLYDDYM